LSHSHAAGRSAEEALQALMEGNQRFRNGKFKERDLGSARRIDLAENGQKPFAVVLACSDSRVPVELLFDQGMGDIFVVRVAGNVVDPVALGSIEYGLEHLGANLLMVLGHSNCGAVKATVDGGEAPGSIAAIVKKIQPSVAKMAANGLSGAELCSRVEEENVFTTIREIKASPIVHHLMEHGLKIVAAKYMLDSGEVILM